MNFRKTHEGWHLWSMNKVSWGGRGVMASLDLSHFSGLLGLIISKVHLALDSDPQFIHLCTHYATVLWMIELEWILPCLSSSLNNTPRCAMRPCLSIPPTHPHPPPAICIQSSQIIPLSYQEALQETRLNSLLKSLTLYLTGVSNIRDVLPFPRTVGNAQF